MNSAIGIKKKLFTIGGFRDLNSYHPSYRTALVGVLFSEDKGSLLYTIVFVFVSQTVILRKIILLNTS